MMMSSQNAMQQPCPYKGPAYVNQADKQAAAEAGCRTAGYRTGQLQNRMTYPPEVRL